MTDFLEKATRKFSSRRILMLIDEVIAFSLFTAVNIFYWIGNLSEMLPLQPELLNLAVLLLCIPVSRCFFGIYSSVWRYANTYSYLKLMVADLYAGILYILITGLVGTISLQIWVSISLILMITLTTLLSRFIYQQLHTRQHSKTVPQGNKKNAVIIGAGQEGVTLANALLYNAKAKYNPYCFVDINKDKIGKKIAGIKIIEADSNIIETIKSMPVEVIIIAISKLNEIDTKNLFDFYKQTELQIKIYDFSLESHTSDEPSRVIRDIRIEDLLFRDAVSVVDENTVDYYKGKKILVTGGGGSIGSEICRQLAKCRPAQLIILDIYENNAYEIQQELTVQYKDSLNMAVEIASVRDRTRLETIFRTYKPQIVFHAAAHKHVPLMEHSPGESVKNNVFGTYNTADMAEKYGTEKFITISTDKAVNPTNIMGATKRMCEMIIQSRFDSKTSFAAVRFGNVLGSNGSVIPLFKKQIEAGGPVTVTDKRIIRYFMTIPEAAQLVMQAGTMAKSGELFVLDMGKPIKILDMAENMIRLSGLEPYKDIDIVEIGLRPGEKLYEELLMSAEKQKVTSSKKIFIETDTPHTREEIKVKLNMLRAALDLYSTSHKADDVKNAMKAVVETYADPDSVNKYAANAAEMHIS